MSVLRSVKELERFKLLTGNGQSVGRIKDIYFDDLSWFIQHIVVGLDPRQYGHKQVLLTPAALENFRDEDETVLLNVDLKDVLHAPAATSVLPVCKQYASLALGSPGASSLARGLASSDPHLRSTRAVAHYRISVNGEFAGTLADLLFDPITFQIRYLGVEQIIDRRKTQFHIQAAAVERFTWATQRVHLKYLQPVLLESDVAPVTLTLSRAA
jgi:hypothetical protein